MTKLELLKKIKKEIKDTWPKGDLFDTHSSYLDGRVVSIEEILKIINKYIVQLNKK